MLSTPIPISSIVRLLVRGLSRMHLGVLSVLVAILVSLSLSWPLLHDSPILFYIARQIRYFGAVPYRDIFDMNMPATYAVYMLIDALSLQSKLGLRIIDLSLLTLLSILSMRLVPVGGLQERLYAGLMFPLIYLAQGPALSFQREYLALPAIALAVLLLFPSSHAGSRWKLLFSGVSFGCAGAIKPHLIVGLFFALACMTTASGLRAMGAKSRREVLFRHAPYLMLGAALPLLATLAYILWVDAAGPFRELWTGYLPLYGTISYYLTILPRDEVPLYMLRHQFRSGGHLALLLLACIVVAIRWRSSRPGDPASYPTMLVSSQLLAYWIYPSFSGQYWDYHWLPMLFWLPLVLAPLSTSAPTRFHRGFHLVALVVLLGWTGWISWPIRTLVDPRDSPRYARIRLTEDLVEFLRPRLRPGDTVQPLDWTRSGVVQGLLLCNAELATSFVYDFHFYHSVSDPFIGGLRERFLSELESSRPRFIVEGTPGPPYLKGPDTSASLHELQSFIRSNYALVKQGPTEFEFHRISFRVWELNVPPEESRNPTPPPSNP